MIVSASRRTDIPAFYAPWLMGRLQEGFALVKNPMVSHRFSRVSLDPRCVDAIVFWTKNASPMMDVLDDITSMGYMYYFQYTLTPYDTDVERYLPPKATLVDNFRALSTKLGPHRVVWRYDPIIGPPYFSTNYHVEAFGKLCEALAGYTDTCVISFMDAYARLRRQPRLAASVPGPDSIRALCAALAPIAAAYQLPLAACAEAMDLREYGIQPSSCIDPLRISRLLGVPLKAPTHPNPRAACRCAESVDIGAYDTCAHGCTYCYATRSSRSPEERLASHDPALPCLAGPLGPEDVVTLREMPSLREEQVSFFPSSSA